MTDTLKYLGILAKVMKNKNTSESVVNKEKYNKLYYKIHSDLNSQLQRSLYPFTSDIVQKCEDMLEAIEPIYIYPEIIGKRCILISDYKTTDIFWIYNRLFEDKDFTSFLSKIYTQIPFIIVNTEDENFIEILNYANVRINLTPDEFEFLVVESGKRKIALNKVVQYVFVKTKLSKDDICVISDNIYAYAEKTFCRTVSKKVANIDYDGVKVIGKRHLEGVTALVMSDDVLSDNLNNPYIKKYRSITYGELDDYVNTDVRQVLYGFMDEFMAISTQIIDYYEKQKIQAKTTLQEVVGDIVRLGDSGDQTLQTIRQFEENREKKVKSEAKVLSKTLKEIEEMITEICNDLGENNITGKQISRYVLDDVFESFFRIKSFSNGMGKLLLSRLYSFEYDNYDLVSTYAQSVSGKKTSFEAIDINTGEWEKAKMLLYILDPENIPQQKLRLYIEILGNRCVSGKELFAKALISSEHEKKNILQESFDKGYEKAGLLLLDKYKKGDKVNIMSIANALVPEACMIVANKKMEQCQDRRRFVDLTDFKFTYYKIAATKQYPPAIGKIVDVVFESRFSSGFQIPKDDLDDEKYKGMIGNGHVICQFCQFLISKMYQVDHYSEIMGIVLFSLNDNLLEAMNLLTKAKSPLAYYCKGIMYEFGGGVAIDLSQAINNYQKAKETINKCHKVMNGLEERVEKRLAICNVKKKHYDYEKNSGSNYQATEGYHSTTTEIDSTDEGYACFAPGTHILMADGTAKCVENIEVGDKVLVYDHYNGTIGKEIIVANVHDDSKEKEYSIISLRFERDVCLTIVKSHALFDTTDNKYVWIDDSNAEMYVGHKFAFLKNNCIEDYELQGYVVEIKNIRYYMPLSRYHLNVFAEGLLAMPPTKLTVNLFNIESNMQYNLSVVEKIGKTSYEDIKSMVSYEEYCVLPCEYLACILYLKKCDILDFEYAIKLFRDRKKYLEGNMSEKGS